LKAGYSDLRKEVRAMANIFVNMGAIIDVTPMFDEIQPYEDTFTDPRLGKKIQRRF
jgi:hypothetical protein